MSNVKAQMPNEIQMTNVKEDRKRGGNAFGGDEDVRAGLCP